jgi:hypothetical protein
MTWLENVAFHQKGGEWLTGKREPRVVGKRVLRRWRRPRLVKVTEWWSWAYPFPSIHISLRVWKRL